MYGDAIERIRLQTAERQVLAQHVFAWIIYAQRQLTARELQHALAVEKGAIELDEENLTEINVIVEACSGLVTIDRESNIIRLVHETTRVYIESILADWFPDAPTYISSTCLTYLCFKKFETPCESQKIKSRVMENAFLSYAAKYWGYHTSGVQQHVKDQALSFFKSSNLISALQVIGFTRKNISVCHLTAYFGLDDFLSNILEHNKDVDLRDDDGRTPLSWAAENGHSAAVKLLLKKGAEMDSIDRRGLTPLLYAAKSKHKVVVEELLKKVTDVDSKNAADGRAPLSSATADSREAVVKPQASIIKEYELLCLNIEVWVVDTFFFEDGHDPKYSFKEVLGGKRRPPALKIPGIDLEKLADCEYGYIFVLCHIIQNLLDEQIFKRQYPIGITNSQLEALQYIKLGMDSPGMNAGMQVFIYNDLIFVPLLTTDSQVN